MKQQKKKSKEGKGKKIDYVQIQTVSLEQRIYLIQFWTGFRHIIRYKT
jgi:hypothetical protein